MKQGHVRVMEPGQEIKKSSVAVQVNPLHSYKVKMITLIEFVASIEEPSEDNSSK